MSKFNKIFAGDIKDGKIFLDKAKDFLDYKKVFEGKRIQLILRKYKTQRSNQQNRYYRGVVVPILAQYFGYFPQEMHDSLRFKFLLISRGEIPRARSTADLTTTEFEMYLEQIRIWALTEYNIKIPLPNEINIT